MTYRDELIDELGNLPADRLANRPTKAKDFHPPLEVDFSKARDYMLNHQKMKLAFSQGIAQLDQFDTATREMRYKLHNEIRSLPEFVAAKNRMEAEVAFRKTIGTEERIFSQGGPTFVSRKNRTEADEAATLRAEQALATIEKLAFAPGDFAAMVDQVWDSLYAADKAARWGQEAQVSVEKPPAPRERQGLDYVAGKIVTHPYVTGVPAESYAATPVAGVTTVESDKIDWGGDDFK